MADGKKVNILQWRNIIVHGTFCIFITIYFADSAASFFKDFDRNLNESIITLIISLLFVFVCVYYPISKYLLGHNYFFKQNKVIRLSLLDIPCIIGLIIVFLYPWYTVTNYLLGFAPYFKQNKGVRFVFLDIPFLLSLLYLVYLRFFPPFDSINSAGDNWVVVLPPIIGYYPYSFMYYFLTPFLLVGWMAIERTIWTKESIHKVRNRIVWGALAFLIVSIVLVSFGLPNDAAMLISGCWFPFVCFVISLVVKSFFKQLLFADIPFVLSAIFIGIHNIGTVLGGYHDVALFYKFPVLGFFPYSVYYFLFVLLLFGIRQFKRKLLLGLG